MKKDTFKFIIQLIISIFKAIATTLGVICEKLFAIRIKGYTPAWTIGAHHRLPSALQAFIE